MVRNDTYWFAAFEIAAGSAIVALGQTFASLLGNAFGLFGALLFAVVWFAALVAGLYVALHGLVDLLRPVVAEEVRRALLETDRD